MKTFKIIIHPVEQNVKQAIVAVLQRMLGAENTEIIQELVRSGGVVREGMFYDPAEDFAKKLRKVGAVVEVQEMETTEELFRVHLISYGTQKIQVIKVVRDLTGLGLKESKKIADELGIVDDNLDNKTASRYKRLLEDAGAMVAIEPIGESDDPKPAGAFTVIGIVKLANGERAGGLLVRAYDRDLRSRELLGEVTTKTDGSYHIQYSPDDFKKAEKNRADLELSVYNEVGIPLQAEFSREGTIFNAKQKEEVNLTILETEPAYPSEYERLVTMLNPLLDGATLASLSDEEINFLIHESEIEEFEEEFPAGPDSILFLVQSLALSGDTNIPAQAFYGWARLKTGLISDDGQNIVFPDLNKLLENSNKKLIKILQSSITDSIIPKRLEDQLERIADFLNRLRNEEAINEHEAWKTFKISGHLLNAADEKPLSRYSITANDLKAAVAFQNLGTRVTDPEGNFSFELQVPDNESEVPREIEWIVTSPSNEETHRETVAVIPLADESLTLTVTVPEPRLPGEDIAVTDLPLQISNELKSVLESNGITDMSHLLKNGGVAQLSDMPDGLRDSEEVKQLQGFAHLALLSPDLEPEVKIRQSQTLMTNGYFSPHDIADVPLADFQNNLSGEIAADHIVQLYNIGKAQSYLLDNYAVERLVNFHSYGETGGGDEDVTQQDPRLGCSCKDCQSAVSPGAYLTDLVGYVTKHIRNTDTNKKIDLDFLVNTFHHPLKALPINCAATKNEVRQVRIAIEVLYKSLEAQINTLADNNGIRDYVQSSYEGLLRENGTSLRDLQRASSEEEKEKIAEHIGIAVKYVDRLYLQESPQDPSNLLSENNLERIFGLPAFLNVEDGSVALYDPLRFLKVESDKPLLYDWRLEYLQEQWKDLDFPKDDYSGGILPIIDPDIIGPDDFRDPTPANISFSLWLKRREWLDGKISQLWLLVDVQTPEDSFDKLLQEIQKEFSYTPEGEQPEILKPWSEPTDQSILIENYKQFSTGKDKQALQTWLEKRNLTFEACTTLVKLASELPAEEEEENKTWHTTINILAQSLKKMFYPTWVQEETDQGIELDPRNFWDSLTEPKEGNWSAQLENNRPLIDPEIGEQRDLPDGAVGQNAYELWQQRKIELSDKKEEFLGPLQTDEDDRLIRTLQLALGNPPVVNNANATWTSVIEELNKQRQSFEGNEREEAERIIKEDLFLGTEAFSHLVQLNKQVADPDIKPDKDITEKVATDLTSAHKQKKLYPVWSQEENDQDLSYWKAYKARLPKWRASLETRFAWKYALDKRSQAPIIDPDIIPGEAIVEPIPGEKAFDLWRERTTNLDRKLIELESIDITSRNGVSNLFKEVLRISLDELLAIGETEEEGQPIDARLNQLTLSREAYWPLLEVAQRTDEGKTVLQDTWKRVRAILIQVWKKRQFAEWRRQEKGNISLSPELFTVHLSGQVQITDSAPEIYWRRDTRRQREWHRTLRSRYDQQNSLSSSLKEIIASIEEQTMPELKDNLIEFSDNTSDTHAEKADRLSDRYLIDMRNSGCQTVTRVGMALEVLQTLVFAIRSGQLKSDEIVLKLEALNFEDEWRWMGSYATWKAAMSVFLFPENILLPSLLRWKTPEFSRLIGKTSGQSISPRGACSLAGSYSEEFRAVTSLEIKATCWAKTLPTTGNRCNGNTTEQTLFYMFANNDSNDSLYWSTYNPKFESKSGQSIWQNIPGLTEVIAQEVIGAVPYEHFIFLFLTISDKEEKKLAFLKLDLEKWGRDNSLWDSEPTLLAPPPRYRFAQYDLATIVQRKGNQNPPELIVRCATLGKSTPFFRGEINIEGSDWNHNAWDEIELTVIPDEIESQLQEIGITLGGVDLEDWSNFMKLESAIRFNEGACVIFRFVFEKFADALIYYSFNNSNIQKNQVLIHKNADWIGARVWQGNEQAYLIYKAGSKVSAVLMDFSENNLKPVDLKSRSIWQNIRSIAPNSGITTAGHQLIGYHVGGGAAINHRSQVCKLSRNDNAPLILEAIEDFFISPNIPPEFHNLLPLSVPVKKNQQAYRYSLLTFIFNLNKDSRNSSVINYLEEAYYFLPIFLGLQLTRSGEYEAALDWFRIVYDYTAEPSKRKIVPLLNRGSNQDGAYDRSEEWLDDPINPHAIALNRINAYTHFTLYSIIRCLLEYGEAEFTVDTVESTARARVLFDTASDLLDTSPLKSTKPSCQKQIGTLTYEVENTSLVPLWEAIKAELMEVECIDDLRHKIAEIHGILAGDGNEESKLLDAFRIAKRNKDAIVSFRLLPNIQVMMESNRRRSIYFNTSVLEAIGRTKYNWPTTTDATVSDEYVDIEPVYRGIDFEFSPGVQYAFCIPENPTAKFLKLRAELNLFKIRNCMNIAGMRRELEPYAAPADIESALPSIGAGGQINLPGANQIRPTQYRYSVLVERSRQLAGLAQQTESAFLSALQSKDHEAYTLFIAKQNVQTSKEGVKLQKLRLHEAEDGVELSELQLERSSILEETYAQWLSEGMLTQEKALLNAYNQLEGAQIDATSWRYLSQVAQAAVSAASADVSAPAAFAAYTVAVGAAFSEASASSEVIKAQGNVNEIALNLSVEMRNRNYDLQHQLAGQDVGISKQQITLSEDRVAIVEHEHEIAELQTKQAEDVVNYLQNKFTNAELYDWMSGVLERIFRYYLQQGASMAKLAEIQLAFERQEALLGVIQNDYYEIVNSNGSGFGSNEDSSTDRRGLTGSARLLRDITKLDQYAFTTDQRKQQLGITFSLARLDPFAFQQFRQTGALTFDTPQDYFDRRFPGQYLRLIKRVRTSVIALVPPTQGISATLSSSGISRVVTGGDIYQTRVIRRDPETIAFTAPVGATGVFELNSNPGMLLPFEGNGVDTRWEFRMPEAANPLDFNSIADILITIEYTALHNFNYQQQVQREIDLYTSADRAFSFRQQFADAWYDLNNSELTGTPMSIKFDTKRGDFPPNVKDVSISQLLLYFVADEELPEELTAKLIFTQNGVGLGGEANLIDGVISTRRGNGSSWLPIVGKVPEGEWWLSLPNTSKIKGLFEGEKIKDILFLITYSGQTPDWPN